MLNKNSLSPASAMVSNERAFGSFCFALNTVEYGHESNESVTQSE